MKISYLIPHALIPLLVAASACPALTQTGSLNDTGQTSCYKLMYLQSVQAIA